MKLQISLLFGALGLSASVASAQVQLPPRPATVGRAYILPVQKTTLLADGLYFNQVMRRNSTDPVWILDDAVALQPNVRIITVKSSVTFSDVPSDQGQKIRVDIRYTDLKTAIEAVAARAGVSVVVDPALKQSSYWHGGFEAPDAAALLDLIGGKTVERWQSKTGTRFFAQTPAPPAPPTFLSQFKFQEGDTVIYRSIAPQSSLAPESFVIKPATVPTMPLHRPDGYAIDPFFVQPDSRLAQPPVRAITPDFSRRPELSPRNRF